MLVSFLSPSVRLCVRFGVHVVGFFGLLVWLLHCELLDPYSVWVLSSHGDARPTAPQMG